MKGRELTGTEQPFTDQIALMGQHLLFVPKLQLGHLDSCEPQLPEAYEALPRLTGLPPDGVLSASLHECQASTR